LRQDCNVDDLAPPFHPRPQADFSSREVFTTVQIDSLTTYLQTIHGALDTYLKMDVEVVRALPAVFIAETLYAVTALFKMYCEMIAIGSRLSTVFELSDLRFEYYLDALGEAFAQAELQAEAEDGSRVAKECGIVISAFKKGLVTSNTDIARVKGPSLAVMNPGLVQAPGHSRVQAVLSDFNRALFGYDFFTDDGLNVILSKRQ
jgi:hypothetical protein